MAKLLQKITVEAQSGDKVKTIIELLDKYKHDLPLELQESLKKVADCDACEIDKDQLDAMGVKPHKVFSLADGLELKGLISVNKILKRLTVYIDGNMGKLELTNGYIYPNRFTMVDEYNNTLVNW